VEWGSYKGRDRTDQLGGNLPQCCLIHRRSHMTWPEIKLRPQHWEVRFQCRMLPLILRLKITRKCGDTTETSCRHCFHSICQDNQQCHTQSMKQINYQWVLQVMFLSACSFIVCWFPLSFTTCFGLHGHLQVGRILHIFIFIYLRILFRCNHNKEQADKWLSKKTPKNMKENRTGTKDKWKTCRVWPCKMGSEPKKQGIRILKYMKNPTHLKIAM
jgi:hypothetical protein